MKVSSSITSIAIQNKLKQRVWRWACQWCRYTHFFPYSTNAKNSFSLSDVKTSIFSSLFIIPLSINGESSSNFKSKNMKMVWRKKKVNWRNYNQASKIFLPIQRLMILVMNGKFSSGKSLKSFLWMNRSAFYAQPENFICTICSWWLKI